MKKFYLIFLFLFFGIYSQISANEQSILLKYKVNNDLITNYDIAKEAKYLAALNRELQDIDQKKLEKIPYFLACKELNFMAVNL